MDNCRLKSRRRVTGDETNEDERRISLEEWKGIKCNFVKTL